MEGRPITEEQWEAFLTNLAQHANVTKAAEDAGIGRSTAYTRRKEDPDFEKDWINAEAEGADRLEAEAWRRAVEGVEEPVYGRVAKDRDGQVGTVRKYSDTLMVRMLSAHKPDKYRERVDVKRIDDPIDWDAVPDDIRDAFIDGKVSLDDVRRIISRRR